MPRRRRNWTELNKTCWRKGDAIKLETRQEREENPREHEASPEKRKTGESDVNPGGASSPTADTPKKEESEHASNVESSTLLTGCIASVVEVLCDMSSDVSHDRTAQTRKFPEYALNMLNFDAFELMDELPA